RPRSRVLVRRPRRGLVEHETHHDGVPQFSALAPVVAPTAALDLESEASVESQGGAVVRPRPEGELVDAGPVASPLDRRVEQRRAHALASPAVAHRHADVDHAGGAVQPELTDDGLGGRGDEDGALALDGGGELPDAERAVDGWLHADP